MYKENLLNGDFRLPIFGISPNMVLSPAAMALYEHTLQRAKTELTAKTKPASRSSAKKRLNNIRPLRYMML